MSSPGMPPPTEGVRIADPVIQLSPASDERLRRIRVIQIATPALGAIGVVAVYHYWTLGIPEVCLALLLAMAAAAANLFLVRRTGWDTLCGHLALAVLTSVLVFANAGSGGFRDPSFAWLYVVPLAAAVILNLRGAGFWLGITVAIALVFWSFDVLGIPVPNRVPPEMQTAHDLFNRMTAILGLCLIVLSFATGQRRAERFLGEADSALRREAAYVRLLEYAAVAANEAATLDEAMSEAVKRICLAMSWPVGHIHTVEADGTLQTTGVFFADGDEDLASPGADALGTTLPPGEGLPGRALASGRPEGLYDLPADSEQFPAGLARQLGLQTVLAIPVITHNRVAGVLEFGLRERMAQNPRVLEVLALVGVQIGRVAERTAVQQRFRQAQKMEAIGRLSAGLAHEINNPMAYVRSNLHHLRGEWKDLRSELEKLDGAAPVASHLEDCWEIIEETIEGVERTVSIVREMKEFSHAGDDSREPTELRDIVDSALRMVSSRAPSGVTVRRREAGDLPPVSCVANQLNQVLVNLVVNAIEAVGPNGWVDVSTFLEGDLAIIQVEDNGPGMTDETRERLFDPFFTTKDVGEGTGLGLAISYEIVRNHGGEIRAISALGAGTVMEVRLPLEGATQTT